MNSNNGLGQGSALRRPVDLSTRPVFVDAPVAPALPERLTRRLSDWWRSLTPWGTDQKKGNYFSTNQMASVSNRFPCPNNIHTIRPYLDKDAAINGSKIKFGDDTYLIGQSPIIQTQVAQSPTAPARTVETYSNAISYGLESGQGLIQIVSDKTHNKRPESRHTLVGMLNAKLKENKARGMWNVPIHQAWDRGPASRKFLLTDIKDVTTKRDIANNNFRQYLLMISEDTGRGLKKITMPLTQIGMPFEDSTLKADDIKRASEIVASNHERLRKYCYDGLGHPLDFRKSWVPDNHGPLILSKFGHGRSATVVTYQAVCKLIHGEEIETEEEVLEALIKMIETGRAARPHFVHSRAQVEQLQIALVQELKAFRKQELAKQYKKGVGPNEMAFIFKCIDLGVTDFRDPRMIDRSNRDPIR